MDNNIENRCRVCMGVASRNIFRNQQQNQSLAVSALSTLGNPPSSSPSAASVCSFDKLVEKLRYVSMIKIEDRDNYPKMICDLCIVQLNVAYNFKRLTVETSNKLDQYVIENGLRTNLQVTSYDNGDKSQNLPSILPTVQIKTEIDDGDTISDSSAQSNMDVDNHPANSNESHSPLSSARSSQQFSQFDSQSITMVQIGSRNMQSATHSDIDFINHYLPVPMRRLSRSNSTNAAAGLIVANAKSANHVSSVPKLVPSTPVQSKSSASITTRQGKKHSREIISLKESRSEFRAAVNPGFPQRHLLRSSLGSIKPNYSLCKRRKSQAQADRQPNKKRGRPKKITTSAARSGP